MADGLEKTGKTVEEALRSALTELGVSAEDVSYEVLEQPSKGFFGLGAKPAKIRVTLKEQQKIIPEEPAADEKEPDATPEPRELKETVQAPPEEKSSELPQSSPPERDDSLPLERAEEFLRGIFRVMNLEVSLEREKTEESYVFNLFGEKLGILIGKHGQTLDSLQYLVNLAANRGMGEERIRVILDVERYRRRREDTLKQLAVRLADKAVRIREEVKLEPMNRHERKVIHMALQEHRKVTTYSDGEEPYRCVVIVPKRMRREQEKKNEFYE